MLKFTTNLFTFDRKKFLMLFKEIIGNSTIKQQLIDTVKKNRVSHAQLFFGNTGNGKLALALAYAQYLNCENKTDIDSCGDCSSCFKYKNLSHPDLHLIFPVLKMPGSKTSTSDNFVNKWRSFVLENPYASLNDWSEIFDSNNKTGKQFLIYKDEADVIHQKLTLKNFESPYRVVLIWMPEKMNLEASNKLLKLFEEPPKGTIFLLISTSPNKLLPTIISRLQKIKVPDFTKNDILTYLDKSLIDTEKSKKLIAITGSNLGKILKIESEQLEGLDFFEQFASWMRLSYKTDMRCHLSMPRSQQRVNASRLLSVAAAPFCRCCCKCYCDCSCGCCCCCCCRCCCSVAEKYEPESNTKQKT